MLHKLFFLIHPPVQDCHFSAKNAKINLFENNWNVTKSRFDKKSVTLHQKLIINRLVKKSLVLKMEDFSSWWREVLFFFIIFIRPTMQHQPPHHPPYAFLWARLTFAYEEYLHVRVEVTRERIWKSQDAHRARNNTRCKNEIFHAVRTKWYALSAPLGSKAHTSILLHPTPVSTTIVIRDLPHWPNKTWRIHHTIHVAITTSMVEDCRFSRKNALFFTQKRNGKLDWRVWREAIRITRISPHWHPSGAMATVRHPENRCLPRSQFLR